MDSGGAAAAVAAGRPRVGSSWKQARGVILADITEQAAREVQEWAAPAGPPTRAGCLSALWPSIRARQPRRAPWTPRRPTPRQTVTIFDWDDTLLCTSWLNRRGSKPLEGCTQENLVEIAELAGQLLRVAAKCGQAFIITNAVSGWVEHCAARWVPELLPALRRVRIISARDSYESQYPDKDQWKVQAFLEVQRQLQGAALTNLVVLGDAHYEMDAAHVMGEELGQVIVKTIRFQTAPKPSMHLQQLRLVTQHFKSIVDSSQSKDLVLE